MKIVTLALIFATTISYANYVPTPEMAMSLGFEDDNSVQWSMQSLNGNSKKILAEFTPAGQPIASWIEMVAQEITFTKNSLSKHVSSWKQMVTTADPAIQIEEKENEDGSITIIYRSKAFNEFSIRRFIKAKDGVYALAYHMRLNQLDDARVAIWEGIISKAHLVKNPEKR